jgi:hypothetical protein
MTVAVMFLGPVPILWSTERAPRNEADRAPMIGGIHFVPAELMVYPAIMRWKGFERRANVQSSP